MPEMEKFEHFQVLRRPDGSLWELGRGAMGVTYKAFDTNLRCDVALKVIHPQYLNSDTARQRFLREARAAAQLRHPNVATVFHLGNASDSFFYAMEYVEGETVEHRVEQEGPLEPALAVRITQQVARALLAADKQKLVHRDIKPSNIMLVRDEGQDHLLVKLIDFGLAKSLVSGADQSVTVTIGGFVGTPHFASPEQLEERDIDIRSDIYSVGASLWFMLTGKPPYQGSVASVIYQQIGAPLPSDVLATFHPALARVLEKCLAKKTEERFQTPLDLKQALDDALDQLSESPATAEKVQRRREAPVASSAAEFATGQIIRNRYEILGQSPGDATLFRVRDLESNKVLALRSSTQASRFDTQQLGDFRAEIDRLKNVHYPNLTEVYGLESSDRGFILLSEWVRGFSFQDLLRARRLLGWHETLRLVRPLAKVLDFVSGKHLLNTDLTLRDAYVEPADSNDDIPELHRLPVTGWPPFFVKIETLSLGIALQAPFTAAAQTVAPGGSRAVTAPAPQQLANLIYELLGGTNPQTQRLGSNFRFSPLPGLSEAGNGILRSTLAGPARFGSANDFLSALEQAENQTDRRAISTQIPLGVPPPIPDEYAPSETEAPAGEELEEPARTSRLLLRIITAVVGVFLLVALAGVLAIGLFFHNKSEPVTSAIRQGFVTITTKPDGATVKSNGRELGKAPLIKYQLPAGQQVLEIESPGYQARSVEADITNDTINNLGQIVLVRDIGEFVVKTNPSGVPFQIIDSDNKVTSGITPLTVQNMPAGKYQVKIQRPGWQEIVEEVDLAANASVAIQHSYQGTNVTLQSDPSGATIYLAGVAIGKTPLSYSLPQGQVELTSKIGSLAPVTQRFTPDPNGTSVVEFKHPYGLLSITSDRADAQVLIGGISLGRAPIEGILPPGKHQLVVKVDGAPDQTRTADIQANRRQLMQFTFGAGVSEANPPNAIDPNAPTVQATPPQPNTAPTPVDVAKPTNTVFHGNTFPTFPTSEAKPSPSPSAVTSRPRVSATPVYRTKEQWEQAKKEAFRKFDSDWDARKNAMKQEKKYIEYWIDHTSGASKDQWKYKKKVLEDKMDQLDDQKDRAEDSLKRQWND
jgi:serine/threonine protein kinase